MTNIPDIIKTEFAQALAIEDIEAARHMLRDYPELLQKGIYENPPLYTVMQHAASAGQFAKLFLEESGASDEMIADMMWYPMENGNGSQSHILHIALAPQLEEAALLILKHDKNLDVNNTTTATHVFMGSILHQAFDNGLAKAAQIIIDMGGDIYGVDREGLNCLHHAARGNAEAVDLACRYLKDRIDEKDGQGATAFVRAVENNNFETVYRLKDLGADIHKTIYKGDTALMWCTKAKHSPDMVKTLIEMGLSLSTKDDNGECVMHYFGDSFGNWVDSEGYVVKQKPEEILEILLSHKGDINARDSEQKTPLIIAAERKHYDNLLELIAKGADPTLADIHGKKAADYNEHEKVAEILEKAEKDWVERVEVEHKQRGCDVLNLYTKGTAAKTLIKASKIIIKPRV